MVIKRSLHKLLGQNGGVSLYAANAVWRSLRCLRHKPEVGIVRHLLHPGDTVIDVGANGADWTRALSRVVGRNGLVFAFEADPFYARVTDLAIRILRLSNVQFFPHGLSDVEGDLPLLVRDDRGVRLVGVSRLVSGSPGQSDPQRTVSVPLRRLDDMVSEHPRLRTTRLIKVDVEGHELPVLRGSEAVLMQARPLVVAEVSHATDGLFQWLAARGYVGFEILLRPLAIRRIGAVADPSEGSAEDVLFVPSERVSNLPARLVMA